MSDFCFSCSAINQLTGAYYACPDQGVSYIFGDGMVIFAGYNSKTLIFNIKLKLIKANLALPSSCYILLFLFVVMQIIIQRLVFRLELTHLCLVINHSVRDPLNRKSLRAQRFLSNLQLKS